MKNFLNRLKLLLEKMDNYRNEFLYFFIKPYWPRKITPNHITWLRVFISFVLFVLLFWLGIEHKVLILSLFCIGVLTDLIDGPVARGTNQVTEFGAMLDSTADRILILPIAVYSLFSSEKWLLLALLILEIVNALSSIFYKSKETYTDSNIFGKTKMVLQSIVFIVILFIWPKIPPEFFLDVLWVSIIFGILSIFSRILYLRDKGHIKSKIINKELNKFKTKNTNV
jgi:CDP-diacylglycerol--glycerol-3-phosphate 3-phosphatidyltransferase